jgi:formylglycine-generating enzyme required for sulfatase activity/tRNA A-37 threonylcarbamoyl transferase component Bud32
LAELPPTPSSSELDTLGARLQAALGDGYVVEGRLGAGGFAVVFQVADVHLKRKLAVKVLSPDVIASHSVLERFRREAETVAQLSHPHIVKLHFIGQKDDLVYLVMEMIDGGSLADRLQRERMLPIDDAARIFGEVASALAHAHKRGVVHRDIKPQNVLLDSESGRALVTDFGIARTAEGGSLTATGMVVGTPAYLSPEQVTGEASDHRADIYALGVMAYEMLAGCAPFTGPTPTAVLMKRLGGPPEPLRSIRKDVPESLEELVDACLATNPEERIQNAADIARALTGHSPVSGAHTTSVRRQLPKRTGKKSNAGMMGLAAGIILAAGIAAYVVAMRNSSEQGQPAVTRPAVDSGMVPLPAGTYTVGSDTGPAIIRPARAVQLQAFGIEATEVTVADFNRYLQARGLPAPWATMPDSALPVTGVLYAEAMNYCAWRHPDGGRLPREEEWEAAARGSAGRSFPWGSAWNANAANTQTANRGRPAPVGSYPEGRSPEGIFDLIGNVWEWTASAYRPYGDTTSGAPQYYVIRGGGYNALDRVSTATFRGAMPAVTERGNLAATGFRCAMPARN